MTALLTTLSLGHPLIRRLKKYHANQLFRDYLPDNHDQKLGTPTLGGALILFSVTLSLLIWGDWQNRFVLTVWGVMMGAGVIGFCDDSMKLSQKSTQGLPGRWKMLGLSLICLIGLSALYTTALTPVETQLNLWFIPFISLFHIKLGVFYFVWGLLVVVGTSNSVNLTDGLDGLAIFPIVLIAASLGVLAYLSGQSTAFQSNFISIPLIPGAEELCVLAAAIVGSGLGFLWFNSYPADVFMGDIGSLSLGAAIGMLAFAIRQEWFLAVMGIVFVVEALSVILQVVSFRYLGRRCFRMAPLHHHFELKGWPETKIVTRFWILTFIFVLLALMGLTWP